MGGAALEGFAPAAYLPLRIRVRTSRAGLPDCWPEAGSVQFGPSQGVSLMSSARYTQFAQDTMAREKVLIEKLGLAKGQ